jgi:hypothetical protein
MLAIKAFIDHFIVSSKPSDLLQLQRLAASASTTITARNYEWTVVIYARRSPAKNSAV